MPGKSAYLLVLIAAVASQGACSRGAGPPLDPARASWEDLVAAARGTKVHFYMWGGNPSVNSFIDEKVAPSLAADFGVELHRIPMEAAEFIDKLLTEKEAGRDEGSIDLVWINGENFRTARSADLLWGPFSGRLPNFRRYVNSADPAVSTDFGTPVEGFESPWGRAFFVLVYDSARVEAPPRSIGQLEEWVRSHPGRFTYPAPPDFTGSAFVRIALSYVAGGRQTFERDFDQAFLEERARPLWEMLNRIEPYLWREGETYPQSIGALDALYGRGEVDFTMGYNPAKVATMVRGGGFPATSRPLVFDSGTLTNTHFVAIPYNAPNKAGAMVVADHLLSPGSQLLKADPEVWGDTTVLDLSRLSAKDRYRVSELGRREHLLPLDDLAARGDAELAAEYIPAIERLWQARVLKE